jgi:hypothetical protein
MKAVGANAVQHPTRGGLEFTADYASGMKPDKAEPRYRDGTVTTDWAFRVWLGLESREAFHSSTS